MAPQQKTLLNVYKPVLKASLSRLSFQCLATEIPVRNCPSFVAPKCGVSSSLGRAAFTGRSRLLGLKEGCSGQTVLWLRAGFIKWFEMQVIKGRISLALRCKCSS